MAGIKYAIAQKEHWTCERGVGEADAESSPPPLGALAGVSQPPAPPAEAAGAAQLQSALTDSEVAVNAAATAATAPAAGEGAAPAPAAAPAAAPAVGAALATGEAVAAAPAVSAAAIAEEARRLLGPRRTPHAAKAPSPLLSDVDQLIEATRAQLSSNQRFLRKLRKKH